MAKRQAKKTSHELVFLDGQFQPLLEHIRMFKQMTLGFLPKGTAFLSDVGMTGPYDGILGMKREPIIEKFMTALPKRF